MGAAGVSRRYKAVAGPARSEGGKGEVVADDQARDRLSEERLAITGGGLAAPGWWNRVRRWRRPIGRWDLLVPLRQPGRRREGMLRRREEGRVRRLMREGNRRPGAGGGAGARTAGGAAAGAG